jgi:competence ComEA-like helix-hairpin-helix protein
MTRVNVNTATRDELVDLAGLRPDIADAILKIRRKGEIRSVEALGQVPGVGPATLEQVREALDFSAPVGGGGRGVEAPASRAVEAGRAATEAVASTAYGGVEAAQRAMGAVGEVQREVAQRSTEGMAEVGRALVDLMHEQTKHSLDTLAALTSTVDWNRASQAVDWNQVFQIQSEFLRTSVERSVQLTRCYLETTQAVMAAAPATLQAEIRRAA